MWRSLSTVSIPAQPAGAAVSRRRPHVLALAACLGLLHQSLTTLRYIPFFALCFGPVLGWHLSSLPVPRALRRWTRREP